jgi:hypothetical protein
MDLPYPLQQVAKRFTQSDTREARSYPGHVLGVLRHCGLHHLLGLNLVVLV